MKTVDERRPVKVHVVRQRPAINACSWSVLGAIGSTSCIQDSCNIKSLELSFRVQRLREGGLVALGRSQHTADCHFNLMDQ